jgi:hypothetical protein
LDVDVVSAAGEEVGAEVSLLLLGAAVPVGASLLGVGEGGDGDGDGAEMSPLLVAGTAPVVSIPMSGRLIRSGMLVLILRLMLSWR